MEAKNGKGGALMFLKAKIEDLAGKRLDMSGAVLDLCDTAYADYLTTTFNTVKGLSHGGKLCTSVTLSLGFSPSIRKRIGDAYVKNDEAFAIRLGSKTTLYAVKPQGFIYAMATLLTLAEEGRLCEGFLYDRPVDDVRGYRGFLPPRDKMDHFKRVIDLLARYRYNRIILEVGGAMEYKRHPEINAKWREICQDVSAYSGRGNELQNSLGWHKNCFHCDNGGGDYLTQDEVRSLVAYCRSRGLEVIPECPTFSHCDYLVASHPEIAERNVELFPDPYPDTYCPHHPDTYRLVFDVLEEVIEVFEPQAIHIGHDEAYSVSICPQCRKTPAPRVYADDVWKIRDFLKERNLQVYMWGEKLLRAYINGWPIGGTGRKGHIPRLYPCRDMLPTDITYLHWYFEFGEDHDLVYHDRGMDVVYGNMNLLKIDHFVMRRQRGIHGGFVSNWGSYEEEYMQRNCQYFYLVSAAYAFWSENPDAMDRASLVDRVCRELYRLKHLVIRHPIKVIHTTTYTMPYKCFYDGVFVADEAYLMGHYELTYADGTTALLPVKYGTNIASDSLVGQPLSPERREVTYSTMAVKCRDRLAYQCEYENPYPDKTVLSIAYRPCDHFKEVPVALLSIDVGGPYIADSHTAVSADAGTAVVLYE